jgi:hypothetical protein
VGKETEEIQLRAEPHSSRFFPLYSVSQHLERFLRAYTANGLEPGAILRVVIDEELLNFAEEVRIQIANILQVGMGMARQRNPDQPIIANLFSILRLLA